MLTKAFLALLSLYFVNASPIPNGSGIDKRASITALTTTQIDAFTPYTYFAGVAYCTPTQTLAWDCGANCDANSGFVTTASGGNGDDTHYWYVGYDSSLNSVVVGHQGTDPSEIDSLLVDADFIAESLDSTLFPGISSSVKVHNGFADAHARAAPSVLAAVEETLSAHSGASVTLVGHSLGAALALLDAVYLPLHLPSDTVFKYVGFGQPRVGNQAFADYVDANVSDKTRITNKKDPVPILPGRLLGFHHASGEVHIYSKTDAWNSCPGQDNTNSVCTIGDVPNIFVSDIDDHSGPYNGVTIECSA